MSATKNTWLGLAAAVTWVNEHDPGTRRSPWNRATLNRALIRAVKDGRITRRLNPAHGRWEYATDALAAWLESRPGPGNWGHAGYPRGKKEGKS